MLRVLVGWNNSGKLVAKLLARHRLKRTSWCRVVTESPRECLAKISATISRWAYAFVRHTFRVNYVLGLHGLFAGCCNFWIFGSFYILYVCDVLALVHLLHFYIFAVWAVPHFYIYFEYVCIFWNVVIFTFRHFGNSCCWHFEILTFRHSCILSILPVL